MSVNEANASRSERTEWLSAERSPDGFVTVSARSRSVHCSKSAEFAQPDARSPTFAGFDFPRVSGCEVLQDLRFNGESGGEPSRQLLSRAG
jgi:hypothetical protein